MREMKDSGIEWFGKMPINWKNYRLKYCISVLTDYTANGSFATLADNVEYLDEGYARLVRLTDLRVDFENEGVYVSEEAYNFLSKSALFGEEVLVANVGAYAGLMCEMPKVDFHATLGPNMFLIITDKKHILPHYLYLLSISKPLTEQLVMKATATAQPKLNKQDVKTIFMVLPPIDEQQAICDVLDVKCIEIDSLTAEIQAQIDTLEQYKRSVITETVTKGLNPKAAMKESGVQWIGEMPAHWKTIRGKYILKYLQKHVKEDDGVVTCFRDGEVTLRSNRREDGFTMSDKEIGYQGIDAGDLVVHGMDGFAGAIGISDSRGKGSPVLNVLDSEQNKRYLMYYLRSMAYGDVFLAIATGIRVRSCDLRWNKLADLRYPVPPIEEQNAIVGFVDDALRKSDETIADLQNQLTTLDEYKKSLIYEYVTGKKEVSA